MSSQARVAASGLVIPVGVAAGVGEGVAVSCAGKELEKVARATTRMTKRRVIPDSYAIGLAWEVCSARGIKEIRRDFFIDHGCDFAFLGL